MRLYGETFNEIGSKRDAPRGPTLAEWWKRYRQNEAKNRGGFALIYPTGEYPDQPTGKLIDLILKQVVD